MVLPSTIGPYRIVRLLGEGGMGAVYEARQEPLDRRVAIKVLHAEYASKQEAVARFFTEAKVLSRLSHPSIVQINDFGVSPEGTSFLVMEYLRGETLAHRLATSDKRGERLATLAVLQLGWQVADVLAVAHAEGIAHRDLKPDNLMLIADSVAPSGERVKILDFGIAKLTDEQASPVHKTDVKAVMGTPLYMSPEQCAGAGGVTAKTDVYSLGCVLYEALAGRPPFVADGGGQVLGMHLFKEPPPLAEHAPRLAPAVAGLVHRMLIKAKDERPDMSEVADELGKLLGKLYGAGPAGRSRPIARTDPDGPLPVPPRTTGTTLGESTGQGGNPGRRLGRLGIIVAAMVLIMAGATLMFFVTITPRTTPAALPVITTAPVKAAVAVKTDPPVVPPTAPPVTWNVDSEPAGAQVLDERGQRLGETPWIFTPAPGASRAVVRLHRGGFNDATVALDPTRNESPRIRLTPLLQKSPNKQPTHRVGPTTPKRPPGATKRKGIGFED